MNKVVLYIKDADNVYQAVDLFEDETISVTSKIQDIRDISKVFTDFSQSFTIPASKKNNKIFKHFYNYFLSDGAFDARKKVDAQLEINYIPFRDGKVFLNGVKMKDNKPYAYNLTFYGNTVTLKDLLNDDELESLIWLDNFEYEYNNTQTKTRFTNNLNSTVNSVVKYDPIIVPLVSHTKRLFFDSSNNTQHTLSGDVHYESGGGTHMRGIKFDDLKPAIRLIYIIEAIEEKYGIEFTRDFFDSEAFSGDGTTTNRGLYMWLSREKGRIGGEGGQEIEDTLVNFAYTSGDLLANFETNPYSPFTMSFSSSGGDNNSILNLQTWASGSYSRRIEYQLFLDLSVTTSSSGSYTVRVIDTLNNNNIVAEFDNQTSNQTLSFELRSFPTETYGLKFLFISEDGFQADFSLRIRQAKWTAAGGGSLTFIKDAYYDPDSITATESGNVVPTERMPKMKIYDFLTGIFKMFNLTAYYIDDRGDTDYGKIKVLPLDDYYNDNPKIFDISKYVDSTQTDIEATIPYSEIEFKYKEPKTLLMLQHKELNNDTFGDSEYKPQDLDRGKPYKIEVGFEHMKFERLYDTSDLTVQTDILWGYSAGDNFKPDADATPPTGDYDSVLTAPLLFYGIRITGLVTGKQISWLDNGTHSAVTTYWRPSNTVENSTSSVAPDFTINFDDEVDEWNQTNYGGTTNSLFKKFYQTYIEDVFDAKKRIFKLTAHLPSSILLNYKLNDRFQIGDKVFTINSIDTNLKTGESKLELLNVL